MYSYQHITLLQIRLIILMIIIYYLWREKGCITLL